jgi:hypothetical protein
MQASAGRAGCARPGPPEPSARCWHAYCGSHCSLVIAGQPHLPVGVACPSIHPSTSRSGCWFDKTRPLAYARIIIPVATWRFSHVAMPRHLLHGAHGSSTRHPNNSRIGPCICIWGLPRTYVRPPPPGVCHASFAARPYAPPSWLGAAGPVASPGDRRTARARP